MAEQQHHHGAMDISEHRQTWAVFTRYVTWTSIAVAATLALMALFLT